MRDEEAAAQGSSAQVALARGGEEGRIGATPSERVTRRERFLAGMDAVVLWTRLVAFIEPHETTVLRFRHLLEQHQLTEALFAAVRGLLAERRLLLQAGTIVDATVIAAPSSTKNAQHARDPERPPA